jgi:hypothetical protein
MAVSYAPKADNPVGPRHWQRAARQTRTPAGREGAVELVHPAPFGLRRERDIVQPSGSGRNPWHHLLGQDRMRPCPERDREVVWLTPNVLLTRNRSWKSK